MGKFPLVSYAHGALGGGLDMLGYTYLFNQMASYGYIIAAPGSCNTGCRNTAATPYTDCAGLVQISSAGWNTWYGEQLKTIDWAKNQSKTDEPVFANVDWTTGVGVAGHSMGGQATTTSAHKDCAAKWDIKAAVLHHSAPCGVKGLGNAGINITTVPLAAYTSSGDTCCEQSTKDIYEASPVRPKVYRDISGSSHLEPVLAPPIENPYLATFTAAWFDIYLKGDKGQAHDLIYCSSDASLCKYQKMKECETKEKEGIVV